jgi:hypothetical protein
MERHRLKFERCVAVLELIYARRAWEQSPGVGQAIERQIRDEFPGISSRVISGSDPKETTISAFDNKASMQTDRCSLDGAFARRAGLACGDSGGHPNHLEICDPPVRRCGSGGPQ